LHIFIFNVLVRKVRLVQIPFPINICFFIKPLPMQTVNLSKAALLMLFLVVASLICWEYMWRHKGYNRGYNDDEGLWMKNRAKVYAPQNEATVFIGSSRIEFDLDIHK